ncbi:unnamed protein product [Sphagnum troendelagicum]|uniref:Transmembrane protein n=1 Tax=Sphagnum troendelagicum TaxID=128251 RepID=A0ABP0UXJ7_9BRYO
MSSSLLPTITIFIGFILILGQKVELLTHSHSAKDQKHIYLPSSTLDLGSHFPSSSTTLDLQSHNPNTKRNQHCDLGQFHFSTKASDLHIHNPNTKRNQHCFGLEGGFAPNIVVYFQNVLDLFQC